MAVSPTLASTSYESVKGGNNRQGRKRARTGCKVIDDALSGGVDFGRISCISGEADAGRQSISLNVIANHLLDSPTAQVAVIDSIGNFDVLRLSQILSCHIPSSDNQQSQDTNLNELEMKLDRVKLMRVFDFIGLTDAVGELRNELERPDKDSLMKTNKLEIPDSEDEEDEMLYEGTENLSPNDPESNKNLLHTSSNRQWLLIIDNIAHITSPLLKSNHVQSYALLTMFFRSLAKLSQDHEVCTLLVNNVFSKRSGPNISHTTAISREAQPLSGTQYMSDQDHFQDCPSIFASATIRPVLGKTFASFVDLHLLLSVLPKTKQDARILYGEQSNHNVQKVTFAYVLEVMMDRWNGRVGKWAAFQIGHDMTLKGIS